MFDLPTNFTNGNNVSTSVNGVGSLFEYVGYATGDAFGLGIIITIFMVAFGASFAMGIGSSFASASFITLILSVYIVKLGLLSEIVPFVLLVMTIIGFFWAKSDNRGGY